MVKLIANMHGNEPVGRELMLALARYLLQNNGRDPRVSRIVQELDIHILPSLNPDGFENATKGVCSGYHLGTGRHNGHLVDLNRAFPSWDNLTLSQEELTAEAEPEVAAIIDWVLCKQQHVSEPLLTQCNILGVQPAVCAFSELSRWGRLINYWGNLSIFHAPKASGISLKEL